MTEESMFLIIGCTFAKKNSESPENNYPQARNIRNFNWGTNSEYQDRVKICRRIH